MAVLDPVSVYLLAVVSPVAAGLLTLLLPKRWLALRVLLALAGPVTAFALVLMQAMGPDFSFAEPRATGAIPWVPSFELNFTFYPDGLGTFFALLVSGIGALIVLYARGYFGPDRDSLYRFYPTLGFFATAMLGIVLADHMLLTLLFWEMTSISSFLLIGWDRYDKRAVRLAMQAFFTTGAGGMAMFGGVLLFGLHTGYWRWSQLLAGQIELTPTVAGAFAMLAFGALTKSAQFPFHAWLPGAMAAPTPVSAYLHSATMVKAGVYLTGRMFPVFAGVRVGGADLWMSLIVVLGAITMIYGAFIALNRYDLKQIFAYTTVSQLGLLMTMYGLAGYEYHGRANLDWPITQIANHAFYKAPLFIIAGALGHYLSRDLPRLNGAIRQKPALVITMLLSGYALAAGPGTISFQAKEFFLYSVWHSQEAIGNGWMLLMAVTVLTATINMAIFVRLFTTLLGLPGGMKPPDTPDHDEHAHHEHEHGPWASLIWLPGLAIVLLQYVGGIMPGWWERFFLPLEGGWIIHDHIPTFWHAFAHPALPLYMSLTAMALGLALGLSPLMRGERRDPCDQVYPAVYALCVDGGRVAFSVVQRGHLRFYVLCVLLALVAGFMGALVVDQRMFVPVRAAWEEYTRTWQFFPGVLMGLIVCATAIALPMTHVRVMRVLLLGACGFSVVGMYLVYQAPDLALTQMMFEIISVILFVLVLRLLPRIETGRRPGRAWRMALGAVVGLLIGWMTIVAAPQQFDAAAYPQIATERQPLLGRWFAEHSLEGPDGARGGGGHNIVNVILVDFRGFDTLGEITVLALAAFGVWSLLPARPRYRYKSRRSAAEGVGP